MEWTTLMWIGLAVLMIVNMIRGGGCCGGHRTAPLSNDGQKPAVRFRKGSR
jgi:hypothetical protein